jgi:uncharacterized protein YegL
MLVDTSASMAGEPIESVKNGIQSLVASLRQDPQTLETMWLSVITFSDYATQAVPLTDLPNFQMPQLEAAGGSNLGKALIFLYERANVEFVKTTLEKKGDWKPLVFILTASNSDDIPEGVKIFKQRNWGLVVACAAGEEVKMDNLKLITESVVDLKNATPYAFSAFFKWVSASIGVSSKSVGTSSKGLAGLDQLPPLRLK